MILTLFEKKQETKDAMSFKFKSDEPIEWQAGQYFFYTLPSDDPDNRGVTRYFTISSAPFEKFIMVTTRINLPPSSFKKSLVDMSIGDTIEASGPDGDFIIENPNRNYVFIAGGIGITPFRSILLDLDYKKLPINVQLLYANSNEDIVFKDQLDSLTSKNINFKIQYFISPVKIDEKTLSNFNSLASRRSGQLSTLNFYVSGPTKMVDEFSNMLKTLGVPEKKIKLDQFSGYSS
jgi:ferredoxin-NADP reductase